MDPIKSPQDLRGSQFQDGNCKLQMEEEYACQKFTILLAIIFMNAYIIITFIQRYIKYIKSKLMSYLNNNIHIYMHIYELTEI